MKTKILSVVLTMICLFSSVSSVCAKDYEGTLSNITMNGKHFNNTKKQLFSLSNNGDGTYTLSGQIQKIGKMPGVVTIRMKVKVANGIITPVETDGKAGKITIMDKLPISIKLKNITGKLTDKVLHFVLDTYAGWKSLPLNPASVTFDGTLQ